MLIVIVQLNAKMKLKKHSYLVCTNTENRKQPKKSFVIHQYATARASSALQFSACTM